MTEPKEDFLDEDPEIPSQRYVLLSFLSPEKVLARKDIYMFNEFVKNYEIQWRMKNLELFLVNIANQVNKKLDARADEIDKMTDLSGAADVAEVCRKSRVAVSDVLTDYQQFLEKNKKEMNTTKIQEDWENFMYTNRVKLEDDFYAQNQFRTSVRGLKVRGVYGTQQEAEARSKKLQKSDNLHNIFVGQVGKWLAWDPEPSQIENQEYAEEQLNDLMKSYKKNEEARDQFYKERGGKPKRAVISMETGAAAEEAAAAATAQPAGAQNMFESFGDLALQRKLDAKSKTN